MTPKHEFELYVKLDVEARVRQDVKGVLEEVLEKERKEHGSYVRPTSIIGASSAARKLSGRRRGAH